MFQLPENLSEISADDLNAALEEALTEFRALDLGDEATDEALDRGEELSDAISALRGEIAARDEKVAERRRRLEGLRKVDVPKATDAPDDEDGDEDGDDVTVDDEPEGGEGDAPSAETPTETREVVTASSGASRRRRAAAAATATVTTANQDRLPVIVAAADVPGLSNGQALEGLDGAVQALLNRCRGLPRTNLSTKGERVRHRYGAAMIRKRGYGDLVQDKGLNDIALVASAANEKRLPGGSLVAATGWCAPSETLYDLCQFETTEGILDLPEMQITRGGIRWTPGPDFSDIYADCGFDLTEAEVIAGETKTCCEADCPEFDEIRLDAVGLCVKSALLTEHAYPELTRRFLEGALVAHQHKVNAKILTQMAASASGTFVASDEGSQVANLTAIALQAAGLRQKYRLANTQTIEVVAPMYLRNAILLDLGLRQMAPDNAAAWLSNWFSQNNLSVSWVFDWQDLVVDATGEITWPSTANVLLYPSGTWVKGTADVINIDAVYDSAGLETNTYTSLFLEEGVLAVQRCTQTHQVTVPICISGQTAAADLTGCIVAPAAAGEGG